jgi:hypothetical protein
MAWTAIPDKTTGALMDVTWYSTHFKANMEYLKNNQDTLVSPANDSTLHNEGSQYSTTSTSFVDVDASDLSVAITTNGRPVLVLVTGTAYNYNSGQEVYFDIAVDGSRLGGSQGLVGLEDNVEHPLCMAVLVTGLSAASHTFKLQWKVDGGSGRFDSASGTTPIQLAAIEL